MVKQGFDIMNNGHALTANLAGQGYGGVTYDNAFYQLMNINLHAQSEHTFRGLHKPVELHMVHKKSDSDALLVVAVPLDAATSPVFLQQNTSQPVEPRPVDVMD